MATVTSKAELLATLRAERVRWEALLAEVDGARMTEPGVEGEWSVKDAIAHITVYERWLVEWLGAARRGARAARDRSPGAGSAQRPHLRGEPRQVFARLLATVQALPDEAVMNRLSRFSPVLAELWEDDEPLWQAIAGDSYEH